jgi:hypothetical protein
MFLGYLFKDDRMQGNPIFEVGLRLRNLLIHDYHQDYGK